MLSHSMAVKKAYKIAFSAKRCVFQYIKIYLEYILRYKFI